jgi:RNA polymerase sigma factor (sigma-70 family)
LIESWETPVTVIATGYASRHADMDDLVQVGLLAVFQSALNYDSLFEVPFGNYTKRAIKNCVMKEAARLAHQRWCEVPLVEKATKRADRIKEFVRELPEPHATIFRLLYTEGMKQREAAKHLKVTQPRVAQMHRSLLDFVRASLAE